MIEFFEETKEDDWDNIICNEMGIGGVSSWDSPVWSGQLMMEFFESNPIPESDMTREIANKLGDFIVACSEYSVPEYIFDELDGSIVDENAAISAKKEIIGLLTPCQTDAIDDATGEVVCLFSEDSRADKWQWFFLSMYTFAAERSFRSVNGYDYRSINYADEHVDDNTIELDDCNWPGIYAYKCNASGLVKIGMSSKLVSTRVAGQFSSLPMGGRLIYAISSNNPRGSEAKAHLHFSRERINRRKEWFDVDENSVIEYMSKQ